MGGKIIESIEACTTRRKVQRDLDDERRGASCTTWEITFDFPCTLEPQDNCPFFWTYFVSPGNSEKAALDEACWRALAHLLLRGPYQVIVYLSNVPLSVYV